MLNDKRNRKDKDGCLYTIGGVIEMVPVPHTAAAEAAAAREEHGGVPGELECAGHHRAPR